MTINNDTAKKITQLRKRFFDAAIGKQDLLNMISQTEVAEHVYNSNAIENSTLTLEETEKILLQIDLERYLSEREMFEAKNLARVVEYMNLVAVDRALTIDTILLLHKMLITSINDDIAGRFRSDNEWVRVGNHIAPNPTEVLPRLTKVLAEYNAATDMNIADRIARLHLDFEFIHPFVDGNGRIGRVVNNYLLIREGYVPINIKFIDRKLYYRAFNEFAANRDIDVMSAIVAKALTSSYHKRLAYLEGKKIVDLQEFAKLNGMTHSNSINKASRQTIEAFLERGKWKIGI
jgi:Fic family protein